MDYQFVLYLDQEFTPNITDEVYNFYLTLNFTGFFQEAGLWLNPNMTICQRGRYLDPFDLCNVLKLENVVEIGYITEYPKNRFDPPVGERQMHFWSISFVIKNLPSPNFVKKAGTNFKPINVTITNGPGKGIGQIVAETSFNVTLEPGIIIDMGTIFNEGTFPGTDDACFTMETYFAPEL